MEWVETTGRSVEEAKEAALDQLGVDEQDAEFEILEEPRFGLFGRLRSEARVRARVRPTKPRPKDERRERRGRRRTGTETVPAADGETAATASDRPPTGQVPPVTATATSESDNSERAPASRSGRRRRPGRNHGGEDASEAALNTRGSSHPRNGRSPDGGPPDRARRSDDDPMTDPGGAMDVSLDEQAEVAREFLDGLVERMNLEAEVVIAQPEEDTLELNLQGQDLGLLIGPKGATLLAIQDLTRTVVQRKTSAGNGRILVDVSGYRRKRREALARFTRQVAAEVHASGSRRVLEPMSAADRKVVHDTVNDIDGVVTISEGEEPRRRVVILPQPTDS